MPKRGKSAQKSGIRIKSAGSSKASDRVVLKALNRRDKESAAARREIIRELDTIEDDYRHKVSQLIGRPGVLELDSIRSDRTATHSQRKRRSLTVLKNQGVHPAEIVELRRPYQQK